MPVQKVTKKHYNKIITIKLIGGRVLLTGLMRGFSWLPNSISDEATLLFLLLEGGFTRTHIHSFWEVVEDGSSQPVEPTANPLQAAG